MGIVRLVIENTASRRGRHLAVAAAVIVKKDGGVARVTAGAGSQPTRGTYARGRARLVAVNINEDEFLVYVRLVRNPSGKVSGRITVYSSDGAPALEAVYRKLKVRRSRGDPSLSWVVEAALKELGLEKYVRKYNWSTGERK